MSSTSEDKKVLNLTNLLEIQSEVTVLVFTEETLMLDTETLIIFNIPSVIIPVLAANGRVSANLSLFLSFYSSVKGDFYNGKIFIIVKL